MNQHIQRLILLQELDALLAELGTGEGLAAERELGFEVGSLEQMRAHRAALVATIDEGLLGRYEQIRRRHARAVVPTWNGICLGCFTRRPTRTTKKATGVESCERCGRILFRVEKEPPPPKAPPKRSRRPTRGAAKA